MFDCGVCEEIQEYSRIGQQDVLMDALTGRFLNEMLTKEPMLTLRRYRGHFTKLGQADDA